MTYYKAPEIIAGHLLDVIRERPAIYLGETSLSALWHVLNGFRFAERVHGIEAATQLPLDFHEWVAYRLHYYASTKGWRRMILEQTADESAGLDRFYELLDEYRARRARVVARTWGHKREYQTQMQGQDQVQGMMPEVLVLIAYTDDPGLFLTSEDSVDFPGKDRLFLPWMTGFNREMTTVVDQPAFDRWLEKDERCGINLWKGTNKLFR
jgi:hypothetical protein